MKTSRIIMAVAAAVIWSNGLMTQARDQKVATPQKTETIKVWGNCDMCKTRIDKAAKVDGVVKADWNKDTKVLNLVYNPSMITGDVIQKKIAAAGHDTEKFRADDQVYNSLPACCHYIRK